MKSFSSIIREEISNDNEKQKLCCYFALLYGMFAFSYKEKGEYVSISTNAENIKIAIKAIDNIKYKLRVCFIKKDREILIKSDFLRYFTIAEIKKNILKCSSCRIMFLRGILLMHGSVSDPQKDYRIDISFNEESTANSIKDLFAESSIDLKLIKRKNKYVLYSKNFETIADIVALIGAKNASFEILNTKIFKEIRNDVNRARNCDSANIDKSVKANEKYLVAIRYLIESGKISMLPEHLKDMALKRVEFPDISFTELGKKFSPPISKSGVFHRLEKILEFYEKNKN